MGMLGSLASSMAKIAAQAATAAVSGISRLANRQEFEAVIAASVLVANADGSTDDKERDATIALASAHDALKAFTGTDILAAFKECHELLGMDRAIGIQTLLERVKKIKDPMAIARILSVATAIANADGNLSRVEQEMLDRIRGHCGV